MRRTPTTGLYLLAYRGDPARPVAPGKS